MRSSTKAFTSIELLVVIAVLLVLTAIVLPALVRAGEKDIRVVCLNNEKQLYTSLHIYCDDNGDKLPVLAGGGYWPWDMPTPVTAVITNSSCTQKTFYCPSTAPRFTDQINWAAPGSLWNYFAGVNLTGYSYAFGGSGSLLSQQYQNRSILSEVHTNPSPFQIFTDVPGNRELIADVILSTGNFTPAGGADNFYSIAGGFTQNGVTYPHLSAHLGKGLIPAGGNITYKDGHVGWKKFDASRASAKANPSQVRTTSTSPYFWW
jgi:type II secretory pathway pseudopilin PulG